MLEILYFITRSFLLISRLCFCYFVFVGKQEKVPRDLNKKWIFPTNTWHRKETLKLQRNINVLRDYSIKLKTGQMLLHHKVNSDTWQTDNLACAHVKVGYNERFLNRRYETGKTPCMNRENMQLIKESPCPKVWIQYHLAARQQQQQLPTIVAAASISDAVNLFNTAGWRNWWGCVCVCVISQHRSCSVSNTCVSQLLFPLVVAAKGSSNRSTMRPRNPEEAAHQTHKKFIAEKYSWRYEIWLFIQANALLSCLHIFWLYSTHLHANTLTDREQLQSQIPLLSKFLLCGF